MGEYKCDCAKGRSTNIPVPYEEQKYALLKNAFQSKKRKLTNIDYYLIALILVLSGYLLTSK